ncbi:hypothetical protein J6590_039912 [Homalodisca vitripennis]|nr:hypothetical protein J6590_039912 [Homalodisca vitripennis]
MDNEVGVVILLFRQGVKMSRMGLIIPERLQAEGEPAPPEQASAAGQGRPSALSNHCD